MSIDHLTTWKNHLVVESHLKLYFERFEDTSKVRISFSYALKVQPRKHAYHLYRHNITVCDKSICATNINHKTCIFVYESWRGMRTDRYIFDQVDTQTAHCLGN